VREGYEKLGDAWPRPVKMETFLTLGTRTHLLTRVVTANLVVWVKRLVRHLGDPENFDLSYPAFQGRSRSLEPTRIDQLPMNSYWS